MGAAIDQCVTDNFAMYLGDSCQVVKEIPDDSIDFGIHSPPFANLYIYSDSEADMGNCVDDAEFIRHYEFLIAELFRVTVPGRLCAVHCKDLPKYANRDDTAGLKDFPGQIVQAFERQGWSYHSNVTIWKCPVVERERTNNNGLLHKTVLRDRSQLRQGMADFLKVFRKPPVGTLMSAKPICKYEEFTKLLPDGSYYVEKVPVGFEEYVGEASTDPRVNESHPSPYARGKNRDRGKQAESIDIWRRYAEPVWWDICQTDVLNKKLARGESDERHICPLQLGLIERCVSIWSLPGEVVMSPFAGIGSEGVGAIRHGRKFLGIELKREYYEQSIGNLTGAAAASERVASRRLLPGFDEEIPDDIEPPADSEEMEYEESEETA